MKFQNIRIRGLKVENEIENGVVLAKVEVLCYHEDGIVEFHEVVKAIKDKVLFSYVRLMGDNHENQSSSFKVTVGEKGFMAMIEGFTLGNFYMTYEYRFYNFNPEPTPLLAYVDALIGNPSIQTLGFAKNDLNQDLAAAILQRLYYNPTLTCIDFNSNNIVMIEMVEQIIKPYFRTRPDFQIIID